MVGGDVRWGRRGRLVTTHFSTFTAEKGNRFDLIFIQPTYLLPLLLSLSLSRFFPFLIPLTWPVCEVFVAYLHLLSLLPSLLVFFFFFRCCTHGSDGDTQANWIERIAGEECVEEVAVWGYYLCLYIHYLWRRLLFAFCDCGGRMLLLLCCIVGLWYSGVFGPIIGSISCICMYVCVCVCGRAYSRIFVGWVCRILGIVWCWCW